MLRLELQFCVCNGNTDIVTVFLQVAILNANYMAARLGKHYKILFRGTHGKWEGQCVIGYVDISCLVYHSQYAITGSIL